MIPLIPPPSMDKTLNFFITPPLIPPLKMGGKQLIKTNFHYSFEVGFITSRAFAEKDIIYFDLTFSGFAVCDIDKVAYSVGVLKFAEIKGLLKIGKVIFYVKIDFTVK